MQPINRVKSAVSERWAAIGISKSRFAAAVLTGFVAGGALAAVSQPVFARDLDCPRLYRPRETPTHLYTTNEQVQPAGKSCSGS
jgi:hypothetical protein